MIKEIFEFNHTLLGVKTKPEAQLEHKHALFCVKAIREEAKELEDEYVSQGLTEIKGEPVLITDEDINSERTKWQTVKSIDALIDASYFAIGGMARAGLTTDQAWACFMAVHEANMTKKRGAAPTRGDMGVPDAIKPAEFVPPEQKIYEILYGKKDHGMEPGAYGGYMGE